MNEFIFMMIHKNFRFVALIQSLADFFKENR